MFLFRLCIELGYPHPDYLLQDLTAYQLAEWEAFNQLDPIGSFRADYRMASICANETNVAIKINSTKKNPKLVRPIDFMPDWDGSIGKEKNKKQSVEEMKAFLLGMASSQNAKVKREQLLHNNPPKNRRK